MHAERVCGDAAVRQVTRSLQARSQFYLVEPLPDGEYAIAVKVENAGLLQTLISCPGDIVWDVDKDNRKAARQGWCLTTYDWHPSLDMSLLMLAKLDDPQGVAEEHGDDPYVGPEFKDDDEAAEHVVIGAMTDPFLAKAVDYLRQENAREFAANDRPIAALLAARGLRGCCEILAEVLMDFADGGVPIWLAECGSGHMSIPSEPARAYAKILQRML